MNTRDLEAFLAVVETGSIVGASVRLHLTQPGVSRRAGQAAAAASPFWTTPSTMCSARSTNAPPSRWRITG